MLGEMLALWLLEVMTKVDSEHSSSPLAIPSKSDLSSASNSSGILPEKIFPMLLLSMAQYITESSLLEWPGWSGSSWSIGEVYTN